jgi:type VI protein secretion system component VasK
VYERLHVIRQSILNANVPEALRQPIFSFPEEFRSIERSLNALVGPLLNDYSRHRTPLFRGVFFVSAPGA